MSQKTYMYDTQWQALINAIQGGDTTAIATALGQIKTSVDGITTALGSLSTDVTQDSTQWTNLINAISSGGGGGGGNVTIDSTQWTNLLTSIDKGDTSALATALGLIKTSVDSINTSLGSLSADVTQDSTQWSNLVNAITNQSITVDLSNITSDVVSNESTVTPADTVTEALDVLKSDLMTQSDYGTIGTVQLVAGTTTTIGIITLPNSATGKTRKGYISVKFILSRTANNELHIGLHQTNVDRAQYMYIPSNLFVAPTCSITLPIELKESNTPQVVLEAWSLSNSSVSCEWIYSTS